MQTRMNPVLCVIALAAASLFALNFSGAATNTTTVPARHYYLTKATINGNQALTACASGYHFASFTEIQDPTVLTYNKTLGRSAADDGAGPPSGLLGVGWVRTGYTSNSTSSDPSIPNNCNLWTSDATSDNGEVGLFDPSFGGSTVGPIVNFTNVAACDNSQGDNVGVWCVEN
jgi:hypothetical protein